MMIPSGMFVFLHALKPPISSAKGLKETAEWRAVTSVETSSGNMLRLPDCKAQQLGKSMVKAWWKPVKNQQALPSTAKNFRFSHELWRPHSPLQPCRENVQPRQSVPRCDLVESFASTQHWRVSCVAESFGKIKILKAFRPDHLGTSFRRLKSPVKFRVTSHLVGPSFNEGRKATITFNEGPPDWWVGP